MYGNLILFSELLKAQRAAAAVLEAYGFPKAAAVLKAYGFPKDDAAVLEVYGFPKDAAEADIAARLFKLYRELTK